MKIIIAGDGKVGSALTRKLSSEGYDLTVIDSDKSVLESSAEKYDVIALQGNCAAMDTLKEAGVESANLLIAATSADEVNLLCCMTAHGLNPNLHTIARIRNPEYIDQIYEMRDFFALSLSVNPERQAANEMERLLRYPGFLKRESFAGGRVEIVELKLEEGSKLCNVSLIEMNSIVKCRVLVCAVLRDGVAITPGGNFVLKEGDRIFVTAPTNTLSTLLKNLGIITRKANRVIICGGGRISYYLAQQLLKSNINVKVVDSDYNTCVHLASMLPDATIIHGDASDHELLESEGLADCDALVTATGIDELNMIVSLYGSQVSDCRVITKVSHIANSHVIDTLALGSIVCPKELCSDTIVQYVRAMDNQSGAATSVHSIADGQIEAIEFIVDKNTLNIGKQFKNIKLKKNVLIAAIIHGARCEIPAGDSSFSQGDTLIIVTGRENVLRQLNDIFE
ncbi:MAG: Trk system potassium transporter TrkA [Oscillospiraceae bacterium]|nr:Trk system potassium transporter TrkA [Oscillospiraceae bacterium]